MTNEHKDSRAQPSSFNVPWCPLGLVWQSQEHMSLSIMYIDIGTAQNFYYSFCNVKRKYSVCCWKWLSAQLVSHNERGKEKGIGVKETTKELEKRTIFQTLTVYNSSLWCVCLPDVTVLTHVSGLNSNFRYLQNKQQKKDCSVQQSKEAGIWWHALPKDTSCISKQNKS